MHGQVPVVVKVPMAPFQSVLYNWVKASGTLRLDPEGPMPGSRIRVYASLNNKCMELRKVICSSAQSALLTWSASPTQQGAYITPWVCNVGPGKMHCGFLFHNGMVLLSRGVSCYRLLLTLISLSESTTIKFMLSEELTTIIGM